MQAGGQGVIEGFEQARLTPLMFSFAQIRATHPKNKEFTDAVCLAMAGSKATGDALSSLASKYLKNPAVKAFISRQRDAQLKRLQISGDALIADALLLKDMAMGRVPMYRSVQPVDGDGNPDLDKEALFVPAYDVNLGAAKASLELLMRSQGMLTDKKELSGADGAELFSGPRVIELVSVSKGDE